MALFCVCVCVWDSCGGVCVFSITTLCWQDLSAGLIMARNKDNRSLLATRGNYGDVHYWRVPLTTRERRVNHSVIYMTERRVVCVCVCVCLCFQPSPTQKNAQLCWTLGSGAQRSHSHRVGGALAHTHSHTHTLGSELASVGCCRCYSSWMNRTGSVSTSWRIGLIWVFVDLDLCVCVCDSARRGVL